jgi:GNAT superfamily N-acetyltransferase
MAAPLVRWALREDAPAVLPLFRALVEAEGSAPPSPADFARSWAQQFRPRAGFRFALAVAEDGTILACMSLHEHFSTWKGRPVLSLEDFFVLPEQRGKGVGSAMLAFADAHAQSLGAARIELDVRHDNTRAQALYARHGFAEQPYRWWHKAYAAPPPGTPGPKAEERPARRSGRSARARGGRRGGRRGRKR